MELSAFADQVLLSSNLEEKLRTPRGSFTDESPGPAVRVAEPARSATLRFCGRKQAPQMPRLTLFRDPVKRAVAHHIMANHELQALEVMAFVMRAFPDAPTDFRIGLARVMIDEQRHTRLHVERAGQLGFEFGSLPVNGYFWKNAQAYTSVLDYLAGLPLTFEQGNLDHTLEFAAAFDSVGDERGADIMRAIHRDEIRHVAFGIEWLRRLKPANASDWDVYAAHLHWPIRPAKGRGREFCTEARAEAGLDPAFIANMAATDPPHIRAAKETRSDGGSPHQDHGTGTGGPTTSGLT
jgi:uncharacterized ferritin-like protein (DUF455 family)